MSAIRRTLVGLTLVALAGAPGAGCESTHEYFDVAEDPGSEGGDASDGDDGEDALPELTCNEVLTCAADCAGDTTCEDACADRVCAGSAAALDALQTCQTDHCATECADTSSTDCMTCMGASCMTQYGACTSATCG